MDRGPEKPVSKSPELARPAFERASDKELFRQGDISLKTERISEIAKSMGSHYERHAYARHEGTNYTPQDIETLNVPELTPPGISRPTRVPGTPKTQQDVARLARIEGKKRTDAKVSQLRQAAKSMTDTGKHVSDGRITQTRRGNDTKMITLKTK